MNRKIAEQSGGYPFNVFNSSLFVLSRDQAFFKAFFFCGDHGSELGMVRTEQILRFPRNDGLMFNRASYRRSQSHLSSADCSATSALTENYMEINRLKSFVSALPHTS